MQKIAQNEPVKLVHVGALLYNLREKFWILRVRNLTRKVVRECVSCFRAAPIVIRVIMGLSNKRACSSPPFHSIEMDYARPFFIKDKRERGNKLIKCYVCVFVCFSTKALHRACVEFDKRVIHSNIEMICRYT